MTLDERIFLMRMVMFLVAALSAANAFHRPTAISVGSAVFTALLAISAAVDR